jgi:hypothetical protein
MELRAVTGVLVSFLGYFSGGLDHNHMAGLTASGVGGWRAVCTVGAKVKARILMIDYAAKAIRYATLLLYVFVTALQLCIDVILFILSVNVARHTSTTQFTQRIRLAHTCMHTHDHMHTHTGLHNGLT